MSKADLELKVEEYSGDRYPDLMSAQRMALPVFVGCLETVIRDLINSGELVVENGRIIKNFDFLHEELQD